MYKLVSFLHKLTGCLLCLLFFMWFTSGIVMIYHGFPRAKPEKQLAVQQPLTGDLPAIGDLIQALPDSLQPTGLSVQMLLDEPVFKLSSGRNAILLSARDFAPVEETLETTVRSWCQAPVFRIDTLTKLDQWIPFGSNRKELPIYKYHFDDPEYHQLYIGSQTGRVLQFTTREERVWACFSAIPHWVYFTRLRQELKTWRIFVKWAAGIGVCTIILGFVLAIRMAVKTRKALPYKKKWYNWHYILGFVFGIVAAVFAFSGLMSLEDLPDFLRKGDRKIGEVMPRERVDTGIRPDACTLDYRDALAAYPAAKILAWSDFKGSPYYKLTLAPGKTVLVDASRDSVRTFRVTEEMVQKDMELRYGDSIAYRIELIDAFDKDYHMRKVKETSLPVYRVTVDDYMHTCWYYNPATLDVRRVDDDTRTMDWLYLKPHTLDFKFLTDSPVLWTIVMYTLMLGGAALSVTGIVLSVRWLARGIRRLFRRKKSVTL